MKSENDRKSTSFRVICLEYKTEILFGLFLVAGVVLSYGLAYRIPLEFYKQVLSPIMNACIATVSLFGAWVLWRHHDGVRVRKMCAGLLLVWAAICIMLLLRVITYGVPSESNHTISLHGMELVVGNLLAWLLLHYPTAVLRPGWLNWWRALVPLVPVAIIAGLDYLLPWDLRLLLALYPVMLGVCLMVFHVRAYRQWCEENYSSMDNIDVQWIWRYMIMLFVVGAGYTIVSFYYTAAHAFTQQWLLLFMLAYSTEQILYRQDPWNLVRKAKAKKLEMEEAEESGEQDISNAAYREILDAWMANEKPYQNPEFRLLDLRQVLPLNRTYLSQFINAEFGCSFFQYVTNYRIEEAKRLMREQPDMKLQEISEQCGFSSPTVFSRIFAREVGMTPSEWNNKIDIS